jgi:hypothetical protein
LTTIVTDDVTVQFAIHETVQQALICDRANARARKIEKQPPLGTSRVCTAARELIVSGEPQRALDLITKVRSAATSDKVKRLCARHYAAAVRRQGQAESLVVWVETMQRRQADETGPQEVPSPPQTCGPAEPAPKALKEAISSGVTLALTCDQSNARALAIKKKLDEDPKTRPQELSSAWDEFKKKYLEPWKGLLVALLIWVTVALLVVRLLPRLLHNRYLWLIPDAIPAVSPSDEADPAAGRRWWQVGGWALVALGGYLSTFKVAQSGDDDFGPMITFGVVLAIAGIFLIDQARRAAPRLQIDATGDGASADHVRAVLHILGTRPPRGLEVPSGTDATFLKDVGISTDSKNPVVQAVGWLISVARPIGPWQLRIQGKAADELNVELFRNHELIEADAVSRARLMRFLDDDKPTETDTKDDADEPSIDFAAFAAAMALTAMAKAHGQGGLGGATKWQSVGMQYVGTQLPAGHVQRRRILGRALQADPANRMAEVAYWNDLYRRAENKETLTRYTDLLSSAFEVHMQDPDKVVPADALRLRALYSLTAASVNLKALGGTTKDLSTLEKNLRAQLMACGADQDSEELARQMMPAAETLKWSISPPANLGDEAEPDPPSTWSFTAHYNAACFWASRGGQGTPSNNEAKAAVRHLILAGDEPALVAARATDPQLKSLLEHDRYREAFGSDPKKDILTIAPFAALAEKLRDGGFSTPKAIAQATDDELEAVGVPAKLTQRFKELAGTASRITPTLEPWRATLLELLIARGITKLPSGFLPRIILAGVLHAAIQDLNRRPTLVDLEIWTVSG